MSELKLKDGTPISVLRAIFIDPLATKWFILDTRKYEDYTLPTDFDKVTELFKLPDNMIFLDIEFDWELIIEGIISNKKVGINVQFLDANAICRRLNI